MDNIKTKHYKVRFKVDGEWHCSEVDEISSKDVKNLFKDNKTLEILSIDDKITKQGIYANLELLRQNPNITNLWVNDEFLNPKRQDSIWYGGAVFGFTLDNRYDYECIATGEVRISYGDDDVTEKNDCSQRVVEFLEEHGINTDRKLYNAEKSGKLYFENNNWFEDTIYDTLEEEWVTADNCDITDSPLSVDITSTLKWIEEWIEDYEKENLETKEEILKSSKELTVIHPRGDGTYTIGTVYPNEDCENDTDLVTVWEAHHSFESGDKNLNLFINELECKAYISDEGIKTNLEGLKEFASYCGKELDLTSTIFLKKKEEEITPESLKRFDTYKNLFIVLYFE